MFAIATLTFEHRVVERALLALERIIDEVASGLDGRKEILKLVGFLNTYIEEIHRPKEVGILVAHLVERQQPAAFGLVSAMLGDHETCRLATKRLQLSASGRQSLSVEEVEHLVQAAVDFTGLLGEHMAMEESILYDLAGRTIDPETAKKIEDQFDEHARENADKAKELSDLAGSLVTRWAPPDLWHSTSEPGDVYTRKNVTPTYSSLLAG